MQTNSVETGNMPYQGQQGSSAGYLVRSIATTGLLCTGISAGFSLIPKVSEDEFVSIGSKLESVTKDLDKTNLEDNLKTLFKDVKNTKLQEAIKLIKKERFVKNALFSAVIGGVGGLLMGLAQLHTEKKALKQANIQGQ